MIARKVAFAFALLPLALLFGCQNPSLFYDGSLPDFGSLQLSPSVPTDSSRTVAAGLDTYEVVLTGPGGRQTATITPDTPTVAFANLVPGTWSISVSRWDSNEAVDGGGVPLWSFEVVIRAGEEINASIDLQNGVLSLPGIQVDEQMDDPFDVSLRGLPDSILTGQDIEFTAVTSLDSVAAADLTYTWYLDATEIVGETRSSITIGSELLAGSELSVAVWYGSVGGSDSTGTITVDSNG